MGPARRTRRMAMTHDGDRMTPHTFQTHHRVALALTAPLIVAIGVDSAYRATTGDPTFITDDSVGPAMAAALVNVVLGLAFLALHRVVGRETSRFSQLGRVPRACRMVLYVGTLVLGAGMLASGVAVGAGVDSGPAYDVLSLVATAGLGLTALAAVVLGVSQLRSSALGWGGRLLALIVPAGLLTALLALVLPDLASPVLLTACLLGGLATLGVGAPTHDRVRVGA